MKIVIGNVKSISWLPPIPGHDEDGENSWGRQLDIVTDSGVFTVEIHGRWAEALLCPLEKAVRGVVPELPVRTEAELINKNPIPF